MKMKTTKLAPAKKKMAAVKKYKDGGPKGKTAVKKPVSDETKMATKQVQMSPNFSQLKGSGAGKYGSGYTKTVYKNPKNEDKRGYSLRVETPGGKTNQWQITEKEAERQRKMMNSEAGFNKKSAAAPTKKATRKYKMGGVKKTSAKKK